MTNWVEVAVATTDEAAEAVGELLRPYAYDEGIVFEQWGDPENLEPNAMLPGQHVKIFIPADDFSPDLREQILLLLAANGQAVSSVRCTELAQEDWAEAWKRGYHTFRIGERFVIRPSWLLEEPVPSPTEHDIELILDPGMAFGTGSHATTQLCLIALEKLLKPGMHVLDAGTGSGILAIGAAKLGASRTVAFDVDAVAVQVAQQNGTQNGVAEQILYRHAELRDVKTRGWDIVCANILAPVLTTLLLEDQLLGYIKPAGQLIMSGIIREQVTEMTQVVDRVGGQVVDVAYSGDWVAMSVTRA